MSHSSSRWLLLSILLLAVLYVAYRVVFVFTVRPARCRCARQDPGFAARSEAVPAPGKLIIASYNIQGSGALVRRDHILQIANVLFSASPDIAGLQEVHRRNWQSRFADQMAELSGLTGFRSAFGRSFGAMGAGFGNALLTRGRIVSSTVHDLPAAGEPRSLLQARLQLSGGEINAFVTHLAAWGTLNRVSRGDQIACIIEHLRCSKLPFVLIADLNAGPSAPEMQELLRSGLVSVCGNLSQPTYKMTGQTLDYIFVSHQLECGASNIISEGPSDHSLITAEVRSRTSINRNPEKTR